MPDSFSGRTAASKSAHRGSIPLSGAILCQESPDWWTDNKGRPTLEDLQKENESEDVQGGRGIAAGAVGFQPTDAGSTPAVRSKDLAGSTVHEVGCVCGFCKMGFTRP